MTARVLVATDEPNFSLGLVEGYRNLGWSVEVGTKKFLDRDNREKFDIVHLQWPEEFCDWRTPKAQEIAAIEATLLWWQGQTILVETAHNLYPHKSYRNEYCYSLYSAFYSRSHLITHFSHMSKAMVCSEYTAAQARPNLVHNPPNYEVTLKRQKRRGSQRPEFGIADDEFVVLMLGRMRSFEEIKLLRDAFALADIPNKRLLMAGKLDLAGCGLRTRLFLKLWKSWLRKTNAVVDQHYYPEEEISRFLDSADVLIVPRLEGIASAIPYIAFTFGKMVIAPDCGAYPEYLSNSGNLLYETGNATSFAAKLVEASKMDFDAVGKENERIAAGWNWNAICISVLSELARLDLCTIPR